MSRKTGGYPSPGEREAEWHPQEEPKTLERFQGRELNVHLKSSTREDVEALLGGLQEMAALENMEDFEVLKPPTKDPDGGWEAVIHCHNANVFKWMKEKWEGRGGGLEARIKREQEEREKRLKEAKLRTEAAKVKAQQEKERALTESERAVAEKELLEQRVSTRKSVQERRAAASRRRKEELGMRLETFEEGVRRVGGFAGAQAATFETALYTPSLFAEEATTPVRPRRPQRPLIQDILDSRLP